MAKKKVTATETQPEDVTALSLYECTEIVQQIAEMAAANDGALTDEQVELLVAANTQSIVKLTHMVNFLMLLGAKIDLCKERKQAINAGQKRAESVLKRIGDFLALWVEDQGKSYHVGEYELKSRKSTSVKLVEGFDDPMFCAIETVRTVTPDKARIKEALLGGEVIEGAELVHRVNLQIK